MKENTELKKLWEDYATIRQHIMVYETTKKHCNDIAHLEADHFNLLINQAEILRKIDVISSDNIVDTITGPLIVDDWEQDETVSDEDRAIHKDLIERVYGEEACTMDKPEDCCD